MGVNPLWILIPPAVGIAQPIVWQMNLRVGSETGVTP